MTLAAFDGLFHSKQASNPLRTTARPILIMAMSLLINHRKLGLLRPVDIPYKLTGLYGSRGRLRRFPVMCRICHASHRFQRRVKGLGFQTVPLPPLKHSLRLQEEGGERAEGNSARPAWS